MYNETTKNKVRRYADSMQTTLIFSHGAQTTERTFTVSKDQAIVFLAPIGVKLSVKSVTKSFYKIFSNSQKIKDYVTGKLDAVPRFMKGWESRTYGPGTLCPDLWLDYQDPQWPAMGVIKLPLRTPLRVYPPTAARSLVPYVGTTDVTPGKHSGTKAWLSSTMKELKGLVFVIACRHTTGDVNDKKLIAHERAQKILKRKRLNGIPQPVKKQKTRDEKLERAEKRKELLAKLENVKKRIMARK